MNRTIFAAFLVFLITLTTAALFCGCYSGSYGDPIDPACDPDVPVVLNGDTIPEERITRFYGSPSYDGCIQTLDLSDMNITESNYLEDIAIYGTHLRTLFLYDNNLENIDLNPLSLLHSLCILYLRGNRLDSINLYPLNFHSRLRRLDIGDNNIETIDLYPIWNLNLSTFRLSGNDLDSASCAHVCDFKDEHPDCYVETDCDCGGKRERKNDLNMRDTETSMQNTDIHIRNTEAGERNTGINQTIADADMKITGVSVKYTEVNE